MVSGVEKLDRRVVRTRRAIMEAFDELLAKYRLDKITVSAIARAADIDRKTFYLHYSSVNDLADRKTEELLGRIAGVLHEKAADKPPAERMHVVLSEVNAILMEKLDIYEKIASTFSIDQLLDRFGEVLEPTFKDACAQANISDDEKTRMYIQFYLAGILSLYSTWLTSDHSLPIEVVSSTIENALMSPVLQSTSLQ